MQNHLGPPLVHFSTDSEQELVIADISNKKKPSGTRVRNKARQGKARQGKARQGKARQGKARQGKGRKGKSQANPSHTKHV